MPMFKCKVPCKIDGVWTTPGQVIELSDKGIIEHLKKNKAIESTRESKSLTPAEELQKVKAVTAAVAKKLVENGITTVDKLSAYKVEQLTEIGLEQKTAEKIFNSFE